MTVAKHDPAANARWLRCSRPVDPIVNDVQAQAGEAASPAGHPAASHTRFGVATLSFPVPVTSLTARDTLHAYSCPLQRMPPRPGEPEPGVGGA